MNDSKMRQPSLNFLVESPACDLMPDGGWCDVPFLRSLLPSEQRCNCAKYGKCIIRELPKIDNHSMVTILFYNQAQGTPVPVDKIRSAISLYCEAHSV